MARPGSRVRIGARVRAVHLSHFCPGGLGFPVASPSSAGLDTDGAAFIRWPWRVVAAHAARRDGQVCGRCGQPITTGDDMRRRSSGDWVHESCPPAGR